MRIRDKAKQAEAARRHYLANKDKIKQRAKIYTKQNIKNLQKFILEYLLSHPCVDCPENDPVVLEFDHVRGKKHMEISRMVQESYSKERILKEIEKCEVRCASCHRRKTYKQFNRTSRTLQNAPIAQ